MRPPEAKVIITGAKGLIGNELVASASRFVPDWNVRGVTRGDFDLQDARATRDFFYQAKPSLIIHCAALSRSPVCESHPELAWDANVEVTRRLIELASEIPLLFFSSDLVFDGRKGGYREEDAPNPLMVYGRTKAAAEELVRTHPRHTIIRISITGGHSCTGDRSFNEEIKNAWRAGKRLNLFVDEYRCPSAAPVIARAVWEIAASRAQGTYHLCFPEKLSRYDIGRLLAEKHPELHPQITPASRKEYRGAPRPEDTSLSCEKIQRLLSFRLPRFSDWLRADATGF